MPGPMCAPLPRALPRFAAPIQSAPGAPFLPRARRTTLATRVTRGLLALAALAAAGTAGAQSVLLAAGAGYRKPVLELAEAFKTETGIAVQASFGHMKQIETQARQNPNILFLVGDRAFLEPMGMIEHFQRLGVGRLVLVAAKGRTLGGIGDLSAPAFARIALPNRQRAVYGRAAEICLERSGLSSVVGPRLLEVDTVPQVAGYLASGEVDAGFINRTEAIAITGRTGPQVELPESCHDPIEISIGVVKGRTPGAAGQRFLDFVTGPQGRRILEAHGL